MPMPGGRGSTTTETLRSVASPAGPQTVPPAGSLSEEGSYRTDRLADMTKSFRYGRA
jgi:hypothetical protein